MLPYSSDFHGYLLPSTVEMMPWTSDFSVSHDDLTVTVHDPSMGKSRTAITEVFTTLVQECIDSKLFRCIGGRHSEPYPILSTPYPVSIERFASSLFGITGRGAHLTAYIRTGNKAEDYRIWVPRRSEKLYTYPGKLDTTVAGGVAAGETPFENIVREAGEEADLPEELIRDKAKAVGCLTYIGTTDDGHGFEPGLVMPDCIYLYDLELDEGIVAKPRDDEVKEFYLMTVEEVKQAMFNGEFKTNCAVVMLDFFIRHGLVTAETELDYAELTARMHRKLPFRTAPPRNKPSQHWAGTV